LAAAGDASDSSATAMASSAASMRGVEAAGRRASWSCTYSDELIR